MGVQIKGKTKNVSNLLATGPISREKLAQLVSRFGSQIKSVSPVIPVRANLDQVYQSLQIPAVHTTAAAGFGSLRGAGVTLGVIDSGVMWQHQMFGGRSSFSGCAKFVVGRDFVDGDSNPQDENGHGTHVASTAAGTGSYPGIAPEAKLLIGKVFDATGGASNDLILAALDWMMDPNGDGDFSDRPQVINMSLGSVVSHPDDLMAQAVDRATDAGVAMVVSAGNSGSSFDVGSPGVARGAITVGASADSNTVTYFSSVGPVIRRSAGWNSAQGVTTSIQKPDIIAPGYDICAGRAVLNPPLNASPGARDCGAGDLVAFNGTSMAAPIVSGLAALMKQAQPSSTPGMIKTALKSAASPVGAVLNLTNGFEVAFGAEPIFGPPNPIGAGATGNGFIRPLQSFPLLSDNAEVEISEVIFEGSRVRVKGTVVGNGVSSYSLAYREGDSALTAWPTDTTVLPVTGNVGREVVLYDGPNPFTTPIAGLLRLQASGASGQIYTDIDAVVPRGLWSLHAAGDLVGAYQPLTIPLVAPQTTGTPSFSSLELLAEAQRPVSGVPSESVITPPSVGPVIIPESALATRRRLNYRVRYQLGGRNLSVAREAIFLSQRLLPGFPLRQPWQRLGSNGLLGGRYSRTGVAVAELLSSSAGLELITVQDGPEPQLIVSSSAGVTRWQRALGPTAIATDPITSLGNVVVAPLDPGGAPQIVTYRALRETAQGPLVGYLMAHGPDGTPRPGFPVRLNDSWAAGEASLAVADLDRDGRAEIVIYVGFPQFGVATTAITSHGIVVVGGNGSVRASRTILTNPALTVWEDVFMNRFPKVAIGQLTPSAEFEIVVAGSVVGPEQQYETQVQVLDPLLRPVTPLLRRSGMMGNSPLIGDLNRDGEAEIIFDRALLQTDSRGSFVVSMVEAVSASGVSAPGWPRTIVDNSRPPSEVPGNIFLSSLSSVDLDRDGNLEVIATNSAFGESGLVVLGHQGSLIARRPLAVLNSVMSPPAFADLDRDGTLEILLYANDAGNLDTTASLRSESYIMEDNPEVPNFGLVAFRRDGTTFTGFIEYPEGSYMGEEPIITDLNGDGMAELLMVSNLDRVPPSMGYYSSDFRFRFGLKERSSVYAFGLNVPFPSAVAPRGQRVTSGATGCVDCGASLLLPTPTVTPVPTVIPPTPTAIPPTPTFTPPPPTIAPVPPTATAIPPTPTVVPPTPTFTPRPPTITPVPPTATAIPPTPTAIPPTPTFTPRPPTITPVPPTATAIPPTPTVVPPTPAFTPRPPTITPIPPTPTVIPPTPTFTPRPPTIAPVPPIQTVVPPTPTAIESQPVSPVPSVSPSLTPAQPPPRGRTLPAVQPARMIATASGMVRVNLPPQVTSPGCSFRLHLGLSPSKLLTLPLPGGVNLTTSLRVPPSRPSTLRAQVVRVCDGVERSSDVAVASVGQGSRGARLTLAQLTPILQRLDLQARGRPDLIPGVAFGASRSVTLKGARREELLEGCQVTLARSAVQSMQPERRVALTGTSINGTRTVENAKFYQLQRRCGSVVTLSRVVAAR